MAEERTLQANLVPTISDSDLQTLLDQIQAELTATMTIQANVVTEGGGETGTDATSAVSEASTAVAETVAETKEAMKEVADTLGETTETLQETMEGVSDAVEETGDALDDVADAVGDDEEASDTKANFLAPIMSAVQEGIGLTRLIWDLFLKGWKKLEDASPLLKEVMSLISNVINLILMPIGTAFAIELIPLVKEMYEFVGDLTKTMWEAYEEGGLGEMIAVGIAEGIPALLEFALEAMELIPDDIPVISDIRDFAVFFLGWLEENADGLVNTMSLILNVAQLIMDNIKLVISAITAFATAYFIAKYTDVSILGTSYKGPSGMTGLAIYAGAMALTGGMTYAGMSLAGYADGGYVTTPQIATVAEREPEYIIPESKMNSVFGRSNEVTVNVYGLTMDEAVNKIADEVSYRTSLYPTRGGF